MMMRHAVLSGAFAEQTLRPVQTQSCSLANKAHSTCSLTFNVTPNCMSSKLLNLLSFPYREFAQVERSRQLLVIHAAAFCLSVLGFFAYVAFSTSIYLRSPEPSQLSVEKIYPSNPPKVLFEFSILIPWNGTTCDPSYPTEYRSPFSNTLTLLPKSPYFVKGNVPKSLNSPFSPFYYHCYTFPVYGTVDADTFKSTLLIFHPCSYSNLYGFPLLFSVHNVTASPPRFKDLQVTQLSNEDFIVTETAASAESAEFITMYDDFDTPGPDISLELLLEKKVSSSYVVSYHASIFSPPSYSPQSSRIFFPKQRSLTITTKPAASVITYSPKNIFSFIGALGGIMPVLLTLGGFISSCIWSRFGSKHTTGPGLCTVLCIELL